MSNKVEASGLGLFKERFIYALVFLFPVAGVGVRHWFSSIFTVLALMSLWDLFIKRSDKGGALFKEEKIWLWLCAGFFITIVISGLVNDWGKTQSRSLGVDIRFLLAVPLYLMLRRYQYVWRWLLAGVALSALFLAGYTYYETIALGGYSARGVYSPNLFGPMAALAAAWLMASWKQWGALRWLIPILVVASMWAMAMSGSRGSYVGMLVMGSVWALLYFRGWWRVLLAAIVLVILFICYSNSYLVKSRVDVAVNEAITYFQQFDKGEQKSNGSINVRFEMWRAGWLVFKDNPVFGAGWGNYTQAVKPYVDKNGVSVNVLGHDHAHNAYIEVLMTQGLVGFVIFIGMLFYPLCYLFRTYTLSPDSAIFGILHIVGIATFSLTDASIFIKGNFVAIFLLCLAVFFSWHVSIVNRGVAQQHSDQAENSG